MTDAAATPAVDVALRYFTAIGSRISTPRSNAGRRAASTTSPPSARCAPEGIRQYFGSLFAAFPDFTYEVRDVIADGDKVVVWWRIHGTFTGGPYDGVRATGGRAEIEGLDYVRVEDGLIVRNDSYWDDSTVARQLGLMPAKGSRQERALKGLLNVKTRVTRRRR